MSRRPCPRIMVCAVLGDGLSDFYAGEKPRLKWFKSLQKIIQGL